MCVCVQLSPPFFLPPDRANMAMPIFANMPLIRAAAMPLVFIVVFVLIAHGESAPATSIGTTPSVPMSMEPISVLGATNTYDCAMPQNMNLDDKLQPAVVALSLRSIRKVLSLSVSSNDEDDSVIVHSSATCNMGSLFVLHSTFERSGTGLMRSFLESFIRPGWFLTHNFTLENINRSTLIREPDVLKNIDSFDFDGTREFWKPDFCQETPAYTNRSICAYDKMEYLLFANCNKSSILGHEVDGVKICQYVNTLGGSWSAWDCSAACDFQLPLGDRGLEGQIKKCNCQVNTVNTEKTLCEPTSTK